MDAAKITANANSKMCRIEAAVVDRTVPVVERMATIGRIVDEYRAETTISERVTGRILALLSPPEPTVVRTRSLTAGDYVWIVVDDSDPLARRARRANRADVEAGRARMTVVVSNDADPSGKSHSTRLVVADDTDVPDDEVERADGGPLGLRYMLPSYINVLAVHVP